MRSSLRPAFARPAPARLICHAVVTATLLLPCWAAGVAQAAGPAAVTISVDPARVLAPVNPKVLRGYNFGNWMQVAEFGPQLKQVPAAALRFPGGNIGDDDDMSGRKLDFFKLNLGLLGEPMPELMVQTRVFQGRSQNEPAGNRPEDAAQAVRLARERGLPVPIWEIGNEPDLYAVTRGDASWTPERYCDVFRAQAAAIKQVDPSAKVAGPAVSGAMPGAPDFARKFIEKCGDVVDVLTWHIYPTDGTGNDTDALATVREANRWPEEYRRLLADPATNPLGHQRSYELGITEYGLSWRTDGQRFIGEQTGALWAAEFALRSNEAGLLLTHYFAYQGTGFHGLLDTAGGPRPTYYAFRLLAPLEGSWVATTASDPLVWAHAAVQERRLSLVIINSDEKAKTLKTALPGWALRSGRAFDAQLANDEKDYRRIRRTSTLVLPARAMAVLEYEARPGR